MYPEGSSGVPATHGEREGGRGALIVERNEGRSGVPAKHGEEREGEREGGTWCWGEWGQLQGVARHKEGEGRGALDVGRSKGRSGLPQRAYTHTPGKVRVKGGLVTRRFKFPLAAHSSALLLHLYYPV